MKKLNCLTKDFINLLDEHELLKPLIKSELTKSILKEVIIDKKLEKELTEKFKKDNQLNTQNQYEDWLRQNKVSDQDVIDLVVKKNKLRIHCHKEYGHQVEAKFLERKNNLDIVVYSLIRIQNFFTAKELYLRLLNKEETFEDLAEKHSEGPERKTRGIVGPTSIEHPIPMLTNALRMSQIGEIQPPFQLKGTKGVGATVIIRLNHHEPAKLDPLMREKMSLEIFNKFLDEEVNKYLIELIPQLTEEITTPINNDKYN